MAFALERLDDIVDSIPPDPATVAIEDGAAVIAKAVASAMAAVGDRVDANGEAQAKALRDAIAGLSGAFAKAIASVAESMPRSCEESIKSMGMAMCEATQMAAASMAKAQLTTGKAMATDIAAAMPKSCAYEFVVNRGEDGLIESIIARPQ